MNQKKYPRIIHVTTVHPRDDHRIFHKECKATLAAGYRVCLIVADGKGDGTVDGIEIRDAGRPTKGGGRIRRILHSRSSVTSALNNCEADLIHLHDPELLLAAPSLMKRGVAVVFDSHEDIPSQIRVKPYLGAISRNLVALLYTLAEKFVLQRLSGCVAATETILARLSKINSNAVLVRNFPKFEEFGESKSRQRRRENLYAVYVGGISKHRGVEEMIIAMSHVATNIRLKLAGPLAEGVTLQALSSLPGWNKVDYLGILNREEVVELLSDSMAGLVVLHPTEPYKMSLPVKLFEYMAAGIPFIASEFPYWRKVVDGKSCGLFVNPLDPSEIAVALDTLANDVELREGMASEARSLYLSRLNWKPEAARLVEFYRNTVAQGRSKIHSESDRQSLA